MVNPHEQSWIVVARACHEGIDAARRQLETAGLDPVATEYQRGLIKGLRDILALAEKTEPLPPQNPNYEG